MSEMIQKVINFMRDVLELETDELSLSSPLFSAGVIDSFSLVSLLTFIEDTYQIRIGPTDVNLDNFDSLERIENYLKSKVQ